MTNLTTVIDSINKQVDGEALVKLTNYHTDKLQHGGSTLKCFCPVHQEAAFRSLILNLKSHTYKCMMRRCACFEGGTFVQFWAILTGREPIEAALDLADKLKLKIDKEMLVDLTAGYIKEARQALEEQRLVDARAAVEEALALDPRNGDARLLSARIWLATGQNDRAMTDHLALLDGWIEEQKFNLAKDLLTRLLGENQENSDLLDYQVRLSRQEGETRDLVQALIRRADLLEKKGRQKEALTALLEARDQMPDDAAVLQRIAALCKALDRAAEYHDTLDRLTQLYEGLGETTELLEVLRLRVALEPDNLGLCRHLARVLQEEGLTDQARRIHLRVIQTMIDVSQFDEAVAMIDERLADDPKDVELLELQARLLNQMGNPDRAIEIYGRLTAQARQAGQTDRVTYFFDQARAIAPNHPRLCREQAEWKLDNGDLDGALNDLFALAALLLEQDDADAGKTVLDRIAELAPTDLDKRIRIGRCLERNGLEEIAFQSYLDLARGLLHEKQSDAAQAIAEEARRLRPLDPATLDLLVDTHLALKQKDEAIEACREVGRHHQSAGDTAGAEQALQRAVRIDRTDPRPKTDLAALYERTERPRQAMQLWIEMALLHRAQQQPLDANAAIREALRLDPENCEARVLFAENCEAAGKKDKALEVWRDLGLHRLAEVGEDAQALEWLRKALLIAPRDIALLGDVTRLSLALETKEETLPIVERWLRAIEADPGAPCALAAYRLAVETEPARVDWRQRLATLLLEDGDPEEAADQFEALLRELGTQTNQQSQRHAILEKLASLRPDSPDLKVELARSTMRVGRPHEAVRLFCEIAQHHVDGGRLETALALYEEARESVPDNVELLNCSAQLHERLGNDTVAMERYERLAEINRRFTDRVANIPVLEKMLVHRPGDVNLHAELAEIYEADGDTDQAVTHTYAIATALAGDESKTDAMVTACQKVRSLAPDHTAARELLVEGWLAQNETEQAKQELDALGDLALVDGRTEDAENYFKRIRRIDPDDIGSGERLGKLYEASGKIDAAAGAFLEVLAIYEKMNEIARAIGVLQKLKRLNPEDVEVRTRLARALLASGTERREAGEEWLELIELAGRNKDKKRCAALLEEAQPAFAADWAWRARLAKLLADPAKPKSAVETWTRLASDALAAGECEVACEAAGDGLALAPDAADLREIRIDANRRLSNYTEAAEDLRMHAGQLSDAGEFDRAVTSLQQALELKPRSVDLMEMLVEAEINAGRPQQAALVSRNLAEMLRLNGDLNQAIDRARRLTELCDDEDGQDYLATLLVEAGRLDEAIEIMRRLADRCAGQGDTDSALLRLMRVLDLLPGNVEILRRIADLTYRAGGMQSALAHYDRLIDTLHAEGDASAIEAEYLRILDMEPGHLQLRERLAEFQASQGGIDQAREQLLEVISVYRDERDQPDDALRVLRRLQALDPDNIEVHEQEAVMLENLEQAGEAASVWRKIAAAHRRDNDMARAAGCLVHCALLESENPQAQIEVAEIHGDIGDTAAATEYYLRAIDIFDRRDELEPCVGILQRAIDINPGRHDLADALARMYERLERVDKAAVQWLELGAAFEAENRNDEAAQVYAHLRTLIPGDLECRNRLAELHERTGDRQAAFNELRDLARLSKASDDPEGEAAYLHRVLNLDPNDADALTELAAVMRTLGREGERFDLLARLERLHCAAGNHDEALAVLDELKSLRPDEPELMQRSIELLIKTGRVGVAAQQGIELIQTFFDRQDDQRALEVLSHITEIEPDNIERRISLARLVHANGRQPAAFQEFFLLASRLFGECRWEDCLTVCSGGLELFLDDVRLRDLMGRCLIKLDRRAEAIEVQLHLAAIYDERGEESKAQRVYETILEEQPDHQATLEAMVEWAIRHERDGLAVENLVRLAESHYVAGAHDKAIDAMERIQAIDPNRLELKARLAEIYLETGDHVGACSTWLATARGQMNAQQYEAAVTNYEKALALRPNDLEALESLGGAYAAAGRPEDHQHCAIRLADLLIEAGDEPRARGVLDNLTRACPDDPHAWQRLAEIERSAGNTDQAVDAFRRLAELHRTARRLNEARQCLESALDLAPDNVDLLEAQGDLLLSLGRRADGIALLARATTALEEEAEYERSRELCHRILKLDPHNLAVRCQLAAALERSGMRAEAMEEYRQAARGFAEAKENLAAIDILNRLLALEPGRLEERELYAKLLRREGRTEDSTNQYLLMLESLGNDEDPRRAIKFCRQILDESPDHPQAHMHLCAIYERTEKWRQAFKECEWLVDYYQSKGALDETEHHIRKALNWIPEELAMRTRLVELLIDRGRIDEATSELAEVASQAETRADLRMSRWAMLKACEIKPDDLETHRRLSEFLERQGELAEARNTRMRMVRLLLVAEKMEEARDLAERIVDAVIEDDGLRIEIATMFEEAGLPEVAAFHYHHLARRALAAEEYDDAAAKARHTIHLKPRHVGARETLIAVLLAKRDNGEALREYEELFALYDEASEWEGALRTLQATIELSPSNPEPRRKLITLYRKMHREEQMIDQLRRLIEIYVNAGDYNNAVDSLRELMTIRPEDTRARVRYIDIYSQIGDESELMEDYIQLARILGRKGSVVEAMRTYEKLLLVHPDEPLCREEFIQFLFEQGQVHRGIEESRVLADLHEKNDDAREAGRVIERALNYSPDELDLRQRLAGILMRTNRRGLALDTYRSLARHYEQAGDQPRMMEVIEQIVQIDQLNVEYRQRLAELYYRNEMGEKATEQSMILAEQYLERELFDLAEHEIRRVLSVHPHDVKLWQRLIQAHLKIGQLRDLLPDLLPFADLLTQKGKLKDAIEIYRQIIQCDPSNADVLQKYIESYSQIGQEEDLVDDYLRLADMKMKAGAVAEANRIYLHLIELVPEDRVIRERLDQTNQMMGMPPAPRPPASVPKPKANTRPSPPAPSPAPYTPAPYTPVTHAPIRNTTPFGDGKSLPDDPSATRKLIRNYENVIKLNDRNPVARVKLAELLDHAGDTGGARHHWHCAAQQFLEKGELDRCIEICDRLLQRYPDETDVRQILIKARVKRDSLDAIDGVLSDS
jgi:tetratricopeptide (TPR) repeat protein